MKYIICFLVLHLVGTVSIAQVGIGNYNPSDHSVLDASNEAGKGILLPKASAMDGLPEEEGFLYFFNDHIVFHTEFGYQSLSAFEYKKDADSDEHVVLKNGGYMGIGMENTETAPLAPIQVLPLEKLDLFKNGSALVGNALGINLAMNGNKIQTRNLGSSSKLTINQNGGNVQVGSTATKANFISSNKVKKYDRPRSAYYDMMPKGAVLIWSGTTGDIPTGWALCDGGSYMASDSTFEIITPDMRGRFVVASGYNGETTYSPHEKGGADAVSLTVAQMPSHNHGVIDPGHSHGSRLYELWNVDHGSDNETGGDGTSDHWSGTNSSITNISINSAGGGQAHENRPQYFSIVYIMKL